MKGILSRWGSGIKSSVKTSQFQPITGAAGTHGPAGCRSPARSRPGPPFPSERFIVNTALHYLRFLNATAHKRGVVYSAAAAIMLFDHPLASPPPPIYNFTDTVEDKGRCSECRVNLAKLWPLSDLCGTSLRRSTPPAGRRCLDDACPVRGEDFYTFARN